MRLDKFLKVSRIIKRRTLAKEASETERILVNGKVAKPSKEISLGDIITISFGRKVIEIKVTSLQTSVKKEDATLMYELLKEETK